MKHRARDALGFGGLAALQDLDKPRCREASRPVGPSGPRASRAPSFLLARRKLLHPDGVPGAAKKQGDDACLGFGCLKIESVATTSAHSRASGNPALGPRLRGDEREMATPRHTLNVTLVGCLKSEYEDRVWRAGTASPLRWARRVPRLTRLNRGACSSCPGLTRASKMSRNAFVLTAVIC